MLGSPGLFRILLGWDGLGLFSYCLVIYYQNFNRYVSGFLTILLNRLGDCILLISLGWIISYGSFLFYGFFWILIFFFFFVLISSFTKRAQYPFMSWLPAAISAPTPISSLVHSSTLVTAGVYLLIRYYDIWGLKFNFLVLSLSLLTVFLSRVFAFFEIDFKRVIAFSTLRQVGLMILIISVGDYINSYFHLLTHAVFKSLLFLCAGVFIHMHFGNQDFRGYGFFRRGVWIINIFLVISIFSLGGVPFLSGFYSKDLIVEIFFSGINFFYIFFIYFSLFLSVLYSFRIFFIWCFFHLLLIIIILIILIFIPYYLFLLLVFF